MRLDIRRIERERSIEFIQRRLGLTGQTERETQQVTHVGITRLSLGRLP